MTDYATAYITYRAPLLATARRLTHVVESEDVLHDVFVELLTSGARPDRALLYWLLRRRIIDAQRRAGRRPTKTIERVGLTTAGPDVERVALAELLAALPLNVRERQALYLAAMGCTNAEIRAQLAMTKQAVKALLHRARQKARHAV